MRLIHLSDPHLTNPEHPLAGRTHWGKRYLGLASWRRRRRFRHRREWLDRLVTAVQDAAPDQIVVTGDLTHIGLPEEIEEAGRWLETLAPAERIFLVPGNHDAYAKDSWPAIRECWQAFMPALDAFPLRRVQDGVELLGVNSGVPTRPASACGVAGEPQLSGLAQRLAEPFDGPRVLAVHHPPFPGMISFRKRLRDADRLQAVVGSKLNLVLHGHDHSNRFATFGAIRVYGINSASYEQGSFRVFDIDELEGGWEIRMRRFVPAQNLTNSVEDSSWRLEAQPA